MIKSHAPNTFTERPPWLGEATDNQTLVRLDVGDEAYFIPKSLLVGYVDTTNKEVMQKMSVMQMSLSKNEVSYRDPFHISGKWTDGSMASIVTMLLDILQTQKAMPDMVKSNNVSKAQ